MKCTNFVSNIWDTWRLFKFSLFFLQYFSSSSRFGQLKFFASSFRCDFFLSFSSPPSLLLSFYFQVVFFLSLHKFSPLSLSRSVSSCSLLSLSLRDTSMNDQNEKERCLKNCFTFFSLPPLYSRHFLLSKLMQKKQKDSLPKKITKKTWKSNIDDGFALFTNVH